MRGRKASEMRSPEWIYASTQLELLKPISISFEAYQTAETKKTLDSNASAFPSEYGGIVIRQRKRHLEQGQNRARHGPWPRTTKTFQGGKSGWIETNVSSVVFR